jgi:oligosaccharide repeat unit polymerase
MSARIKNIKLLTKKNVTFLIICGLLLIGSFHYIDSTRGQYDYTEYRLRNFKALSKTNALLPTPILSAYYYSTTSIANLNDFIHRYNGDYYFGTAVLNPIVYLLKKFHIVEELGFKNAKEVSSSKALLGSNIFTILRAFYQDYGLSGCFLWSFFYAITLTWLYRSYQNSRSLPKLVLFAYFSINVLTAPYEYMLYTTFSLFAFIFIGIVFHWLTIQNNRSLN